MEKKPQKHEKLCVFGENAIFRHFFGFYSNFYFLNHMSVIHGWIPCLKTLLLRCQKGWFQKNYFLPYKGTRQIFKRPAMRGRWT